MKQDEFNTSFSISGRRKLVEGLTIAGGFGRVVRTLNAVERYSDQRQVPDCGGVLGAPAGEPEASYQCDLALEYSAGNFTVFGGVFYWRITDYLTAALDPEVPKKLPLSPPVVYRYVSGDDANFRRFNCGARWRFLSRLLGERAAGCLAGVGVSTFAGPRRGQASTGAVPQVSQSKEGQKRGCRANPGRQPGPQRRRSCGVSGLPGYRWHGF